MSANSPDTSGLLLVWPGRITCTTGVLIRRVRFQVDITDGWPDDALDDYEDVVESSYRSIHGQLVLLDWAGRHVLSLPELPAGAGDYRLRYHARGMDGDRGSTGAACLLQIWEAGPRPAAELKISSETGNFWHPSARLIAPFTAVRHQDPR